MTEEVTILKNYSSEIEAGIAQQILIENGVRSFIFKDDAGGMEPHLQRTNGVRLLIDCLDTERANEILEELVSI